ncbi:MAG TPA: poly-gamma-glutamate system protein [candidate division Zixibacteria bacterium]|nr:poly-gamma-glutamate system protein [candidate division Zixibacteria bacterium]
MPSARKTWGLLAVLAICVALVVMVDHFWTSTQPHPHASQMRAAVAKTVEWFNLIKELKSSRGIEPPASLSSPFAFMIGDDFSSITTTIGSLEAKIASTNPEFAAVIVRWLLDSGIDSNSVTGVVLSASFPSLAVSTLAAIQTVGCRAVVISSMGASTYGANQPECTWLDMEHWLQTEGDLRYRSEIVTFGAEGDCGDGLAEEGLDAMRLAAQRCGYEVWIPETLEKSVERKIALLRSNDVDLLINIGGNQASLGACSHAATIPNGYNPDYRGCNDPDRGIITRLSQQSVPFVHLLNIRDLAVRYDLDLTAERVSADDQPPYAARTVDRVPVILGIVFVWGLLWVGRTKVWNEKQG